MKMLRNFSILKTFRDVHTNIYIIFLTTPQCPAKHTLFQYHVIFFHDIWYFATVNPENI